MSLQHPAPSATPSGPDNGWRPRGPEPRNGTPAAGPAAASPPSAAAPAIGERLPRPPRRRNAGLAAVAVLLVAGSAAVAGLVALRIDDRVDVLVARTEIPAGQRITRDMLGVAPVAQQGLDVIPGSDAAAVVGRYAAVSIPTGRLIDHAMLTDRPALRSGTTAVGVAVAPGQMPADGLQAGDRVTVYGTDGEGVQLTDQAVVSFVQQAKGGTFGGGDDTTVVTLLVPAADAAKVVAASAAGKISLGLTGRGDPAGNG